MAFSGITTRGSAVSNTSGTTLAVNPSANIVAGLLAIVCCASDNPDISNATRGSSAFHTVTDSKSNTWTKIGEYTETEGAGSDGATVSVWASKLTTTILTTDTITITLGAARTDKIISVMEAAMGSGKTFAVQAVGIGINSLSATINPMPSREYLLIGAAASEGEDNAKTPDGDYTERFDLITSTTGNLDVNIALHVQTRITTLTSDTVTSSAWTNTNVIQTLSALYEIDESGGSSDVSFSGNVASAGNRGFENRIIFPLTVTPNTNRLLVIGIAGYIPGGATITSVKYGGVDCTHIITLDDGGGTFNALYRLTAPTVGTANIEVLFNNVVNALACGAAVFYNVDQTTPISNAVSDIAATDNVSSATGNLVVDCLAAYPDQDYVAGTGQSHLWQVNDGGAGVRGAMSYKSGETTTTMSWSPAPDYPVITAVNLNKAAAPPSSRRIFIIS